LQAAEQAERERIAAEQRSEELRLAKAQQDQRALEEQREREHVAHQQAQAKATAEAEDRRVEEARRVEQARIDVERIAAARVR
jgi:hypothetical protein